VGSLGWVASCGFRDSSERVHADGCFRVCLMLARVGSALASYTGSGFGFAMLLRSGMGSAGSMLGMGWVLAGHMVVVLLHYTMLRNLSRCLGMV